ncbi:unnamed protein product [Mesocestoides corti]|uniref:SHSP domain-containing protein n=1 Tax=Mesocestoides corti TaxID=53468 RepID=A0A0R3U734_MESCO|nr:unnamed protein product [Mesocestoides corti]
MPRARPRSLNIRTPIGDVYGSPLRSVAPHYSSRHGSPPRLRLCRQCSGGYFPVMPSATLYSVPYVVPMMYAPAPAPIATHLPPPIVYEDLIPVSPEPPYPLYETDETDIGEVDDLRTSTEETFSTMQRSTLRRMNTTPSNLIRDFEETKWLSIDDKLNSIQDCTIRRNSWFQRSVELPSGVITRLSCDKLEAEPSENSTMRRTNVQKLRIYGKVRRWSPTLRAIAEQDFNEELILPQNTDLSTVSYKLQTKNIHQYNDSRFNHSLRHHSTSYDVDEEGQPFTENTVVVTGKVLRTATHEVHQPIRTWSKEYKQTVRGTVDLSPEGRVVNPIITTYSEMPEALVDLAPTPDKDTSYALTDDGCQIKIRLDEKVDHGSVQLDVDPREETVKVVFARHSKEDSENGLNEDDQEPTTTTNYDMQVNQTFKLSAKKFDTSKITKKIQGQDLLIFIPFSPHRLQSSDGHA